MDDWLKVMIEKEALTGMSRARALHVTGNNAFSLLILVVCELQTPWMPGFDIFTP